MIANIMINYFPQI